MKDFHYAATGNLVTYRHCLNTKDRYVCVVDRGHEYVVCEYRSGDHEWQWGHYFDSEKVAMFYYNSISPR